jgi:hypothetical protein
MEAVTNLLSIIGLLMLGAGIAFVALIVWLHFWSQ